jgi:hypothetical protein
MFLDGIVLVLELFGHVWNLGKMRYKYGNILTKYGIPQIRTEKLHFYFCSHSDNLRPEFRTDSGFSRKCENGRVKCRKTDGSDREKFRPFSTLPSVAVDGSQVTDLLP